MSPTVRWALVAAGAAAALAALVLWSWSTDGRYAPTGDEPHYLLLADALLPTPALEQTGTYAEEYRGRRWSDDWPAAGTPVDSTTTHTVVGPRGRFSVHNLGLPALLAVPVAAGGLAGARAATVLVVAGAAALACAAGARRTRRPWRAAAVAAALTCALPFAVAGGQIYPDLAAGLLFASGALALSREAPPRLATAIPWLAAAVLPWLQIKLAPLAVLLVAAALVRRSQAACRPSRRLVPLMAAPLISVSVLFAYNAYAFGDVSGPYGQGALRVELRALQTGLGLVLDAEQGLLLRHPLLVVAGVAGLVALWRSDRVLGLLLAAGSVGVTALNAMHENWYGGASFAGRFGWTAAVILLVPAARTLVGAWERRPRLVPAVLLVSALLQAVLLWRVAAPDRTADLLYAEPDTTPLWAYGELLAPVQRWLPAFYDPDWSWRYAQNWLWLVGVLLVLAAALLVQPARRAAAAGVTAALAATAVALGPMTAGAPRAALTTSFDAEVVPGSVGSSRSGSRLAVAGRDAPGTLVSGPGHRLPAGDWRAVVEAQATAPGTTVRVVAREPDGRPRPLTTPVPLDDAQTLLAFRLDAAVDVDVEVEWAGSGRVEVRRVALQRTDWR